jgi:hypothetical protein
VLLTPAYRSLPRPSSPLCAQASSIHFRSLDIHIRRQAEYYLRAISILTSDTICLYNEIESPMFRFVIPQSLLPSIVKQQLQRSAPEQIKVKVEIEDARDERLPLRTFRSIDPTRHSGKEVIQPQVPLRLPCYDFAPVTALALGRLVPCGFLHGLRALTASMA